MNCRLKETLHLQEEPINKEQIKQICRNVKPLLDKKQERGRIKFSAFLKRQLRFMGWHIRLVQSAALLLLCVLFQSVLEGLWKGSIQSMAFFLCCLSVLVLLSAVPMVHRSFQYKMHEIEMSTRFSAVKLLLAKLLVIGIENVVLLSMILLLTLRNTSLQMGSALLYLLLPYFMAGSGFLYLLGHTPADKLEGYSAGMGCLLFGGFTLLNRFHADFFRQTFSVGWAVVCLLLLLFCIRQLRYLMRCSAYAEIA